MEQRELNKLIDQLRKKNKALRQEVKLLKQIIRRGHELRQGKVLYVE